MIRLRDLSADDEPMLLEWRNRPEIARFMFSDHRIGEQEHAVWFRRAVEGDGRWDQVIVCDDEDVGLISLYDIDRRHRRCTWGFYLAEPAVRGRGAGSVAWYSTLDHAFDTLELHRVWSEVLDFNESVIRMHESFGFRREGVYRQHVRKDSRWHDVVALAILREEWHARRDDVRRKLVEQGHLASFEAQRE